MQILKCKMCGGDLRIEEGKTVCECEYCGSKQTVPSVDNEKKVNLFSRANRLRSDNEFDKAYGIYESIVTEFPNEAEAYWGLILCDFGIEYVDDPKTGNKIPTCHRSSFDSVFDDKNYKMVLENADAVAKNIYQEEAEHIENLRKNIIELSAKEDAYDVFICYKETDNNGNRTIDSVLAQEIYNELVEKDYKVFFSRITLEDKLGQEYEPYIFAALNSAKVMLVIGTSYDNFDAIWVKNEWSRYLSLIEQGKKKILIPCYKNIDAYDMPKEFLHLQAQDMSKLGFMQDLLHGIEKIVGNKSKKSNVEKNIMYPTTNKNVDALLDRGYMALEDENWNKADEYFEQILNLDSQCGKAYLGKLLIENKASDLKKLKSIRVNQYYSENKAICEVKEIENDNNDEFIENYIILGYLKKEELRQIFKNFDFSYESEFENRRNDYNKECEYLENNKLLQRANRFLDKEEKKELDSIINEIKSILESKMNNAKLTDEKMVKQIIDKYNEYKEECKENIKAKYEMLDKKRKEEYEFMTNLISNTTKMKECKICKRYFEKLGDYRDSNQYIKLCNEKAEKIHKKNDKIKLATIVLLILMIIFTIVFYKFYLPKIFYDKAKTLSKNNDYEQSIDIYEKIIEYKDSRELLKEVEYLYANKLVKESNYEEAINIYEKIIDYKDCKELQKEAKYLYANELMKESKIRAVRVLEENRDYKDSKQIINSAYLEISKKYYDRGVYVEALSFYKKVENYDTNAELYKDCLYNIGLENLREGNYSIALESLDKILDYKDVSEKRLIAMYSYAKENKNRENRTTYQYLKELKEKNYEDSADIFKELYSWKVESIVNSSPDDEETDFSSISVYNPVYFHIKVSGGELGDSTKIKVEVVFPYGEKRTDEWENEFTSDSTGSWYWANGVYDNSLNVTRGTLQIKYYDENNNLIGEDSVLLY